jgi:hypothetical protein
MTWGDGFLAALSMTWRDGFFAALRMTIGAGGKEFQDGAVAGDDAKFPGAEFLEPAGLRGLSHPAFGADEPGFVPPAKGHGVDYDAVQGHEGVGDRKGQHAVFRMRAGLHALGHKALPFALGEAHRLIQVGFPLRLRAVVGFEIPRRLRVSGQIGYYGFRQTQIMDRVLQMQHSFQEIIIVRWIIEHSGYRFNPATTP